ncbi:MAG: hypothetical protein PHY87_03735, partial [Sphaerochaeta sp.]|nr:hypothetical protein [Sphaerochaeta sp.]
TEYQRFTTQFTEFLLDKAFLSGKKAVLADILLLFVCGALLLLLQPGMQLYPPLTAKGRLAGTQVNVKVL